MLLRPLLRQHPSHRCIWKNIQLSRRIHRSVGIVGLPNVGKSTFFNALTKTQIAQAANYPFCTIDPNIALTAVPDERVRQLAKLENSQKTIETQVGTFKLYAQC